MATSERRPRRKGASPRSWAQWIQIAKMGPHGFRACQTLSERNQFGYVYACSVVGVVDFIVVVFGRSLNGLGISSTGCCIDYSETCTNHVPRGNRMEISKSKDTPSNQNQIGITSTSNRNRNRIWPWPHLSADLGARAQMGQGPGPNGSK
jgi:hypothetical protein